MPPLVSVIIPVHNTGHFAAEAVESALAQTYPHAEVIVVDDGSLEPTEWLVKQFAGRIAYYAKPNGGPASARNLGTQRSRGELVAFLDADDVWEPGKLEVQVAALERCPRAGLAYAAVAKMDRAGQVLEGQGPPELRPSGRVLPELFMRNFIPTSTVVARRACLDEAGGFDEWRRLISVEDYDLWLRIAERHDVVYVPQRLVRYRMHPDGISQDIGRSYWGEKLVIERAVERCRAGHPELALRMRPRLRRLFFEFGYDLFTRRDLRGARRRFVRSLRYGPWQPKVWAYVLATFLTPAGVDGVRQVKRLGRRQTGFLVV